MGSTNEAPQAKGTSANYRIRRVQANSALGKIIDQSINSNVNNNVTRKTSELMRITPDLSNGDTVKKTNFIHEASNRQGSEANKESVTQPSTRPVITTDQTPNNQHLRGFHRRS